MVQGYYTLQEAAQALGLPPEELKLMAQRNQIRSFQDRGTWRFRVQDIQELARQRGAASDMELVLGDAPARSPQPKSAGPKSGPRSPGPRSPTAPKPGSPPPRSPSQKSPQPKAPDVFDFAVDTGHERDSGAVLADTPSKRPGSKKPSPVPQAGSDSDVKLVHAEGAAAPPEEPGQKHGSDSDVKLVGSSSDSDVKLVQEAGTPRTPKVEGPRKSGLAGGQATPPVGKRPSQLSSPPATPDSGVRLIPSDSDSDVKIIGATDVDVPLGEDLPKLPTDSDIRLEAAPPGSRSDEGMLTEEINLDEELKKHQTPPVPQAKVKPKSKLPKFPQSSPFELTESEVHLDAPAPAKPDSSDYDLTPGGHKPEDSSDDFSLELPDDSDFNVQLSDSVEAGLKGPSSGISISNPKDSGISLEQGGEGSDEIEFELSLDAAESTPKPASSPADSDSEFELSLDVDDSGPQAKAGGVSDSEFELTLDDSNAEAPQHKAGAREKDIFETDFDVPNLEDSSGSEVAALDTDLDSSDFDLALQDSDVAVDEESGSQVVALDEEQEADQGAATVSAKHKPKKKAAADLEEDVDFGDIEEEPAAEEEEERVVVQQKVVKPAPWGAFPTFFMLPCVIVMVLVGIMGFEMLQHMTGYKPAGPLTRTVGDIIGQKIK